METFAVDTTRYWHDYAFPPCTRNVMVQIPIHRKNGPLAVVVQELTGENADLSPSGQNHEEVSSNGSSQLPEPGPDVLSRPFTVLSPLPAHELLCRVVPVGDAYHVQDPDGHLLARIARRPSRFFPWPRRVQWLLETAQPDSSIRRCIAYKGTIRAWIAFYVLSPIWGALALFGILATILGERSPWFLWDLPSRTNWRLSMFRWGGLDYRGVHSSYRLNPEMLDSRIAYAQAIIHRWA